MLQLVSVLCVTILIGQLVDCRPSTLSKSDENDKFGFTYEVSHYPGSSNVHMTFGKSKYANNPGDHAKHLHSSQSLPYKSQPPVHSGSSDYAEDRPKPVEKLPPPIYDSASSGQNYPSPYDSANKQKTNEYDESYNPEFNQSPSSHVAIPSQSYDTVYDNHQSDNSNYPSQEDISLPSPSHEPNYVNQEVYAAPVSQQYIDSPPVLSAENHASDQSYPIPVNQYSSDVPLQSLVSFEAPIPQPTFDNNQNTDYRYPLVQQPESPVKQLDTINIEAPYSHTQQDISQNLNLHYGVAVDDAIHSPNNQFNEDYSDSTPVIPVGPKYAIIPSGPAYTRDSFTAEIVHGPSKETIPDISTYDTPSKSDENIEVPPVSHAFRLPSISDTSSPKLSENSHIAADSISADEENNTPVISHSTRLLIPASPDSPKSTGDNFVPDPLPSFQPIDNYGSIPEIGTFDSQSPNLVPYHLPDISPSSYSSKLNVPHLHLTPGVLPEVPDTKPEDNYVKESLRPISIDTGSEIPPASHSFKLTLPSAVPGKVPDDSNIDDHTAVDANQHSLDSVSPVSHSVRLWPPTFPDGGNPHSS